MHRQQQPDIAGIMPANNQSMYIFTHISYFFTCSEKIDYQLGLNSQLSLSNCLNNLQTTKINLSSAMTIFSLLFKNQKRQTPEKANSLCLQINQTKIEQLLSLDTLTICINALKAFLSKLTAESVDYTQKNRSKSDIAIDLEVQMLLKCLLNIFYTFLYYLWKRSIEKNDENAFKSIKSMLQQFQIDEMLMKMVGMSLEAHYIPMKKLTMAYTLVLNILFSKDVAEGSSFYNDSNITQLAFNNLLPENYLQQSDALKRQRHGPVEDFYRKHNVGECPLAQFIVVGLLRSLLTICNSQNHKKFTTQKVGGVDSFRQWQISYVYALENMQALKSRLSEQALQLTEKYRKFNQSSDNSKGQPNTQSQLFAQFYSHKIYSTSAVVLFFLFMLIKFKQNRTNCFILIFIQYSYFLQLISDANGILVFLKFLTDKFQNLDTVQPIKFLQRNKAEFKLQVMLTVYSVLQMLFITCNNYPQKIKNFLFEYNSYLIIRKLPRIFMKVDPSIKVQGENALPNQTEIKALTQQVTSQQYKMLPKFTQLCYDMLKIQIPFFSKKMKESSNNMRMIVDIYCRYPKKVKPIQLSSFDKIRLISKMKQKEPKYITSVQDLKNVHNQFNNVQYWGNDFIKQKQFESRNNENVMKNKNKSTNKMVENEKLSPKEVQLWLQDNIWRYYD